MSMVKSLALMWLLVAAMVCQVVDAQEYHEVIEPVPNWVNIRDASPVTNIPIKEINNGVFYRLLDSQLMVARDGGRTTYSRYIEQVVNQTGVENSSQINLVFDPSYQRVALHSLTIKRDGVVIDKLGSAKITTLNSESELDQQIYHGNLTINILIDDMRAGDTLDYSYTYYGANPIYDGIFSYARWLNWSVPVHDQYVRIMWGKEAPLHINSRNIEPQVTQQKNGRFTEYQIHRHNITPINEPSETPDWYSPYGVVYFSEIEHWHEVVAWAKPLYATSNDDPQVNKIAQQIKRSASDSDSQIVAALKYVQQNIRYVGLQMGINSHQPAQPIDTLRLRYGDCKGKAILLIAILKALNIDAYPALVDTEQTKLLLEYPPALNHFDHVLVTLEREDGRVWLDPTLRDQLGSLDNLYQPDYGYALVLKEGEQGLTSMTQPNPNSYFHVLEQYTIGSDVDQPVNFAVVTDYLGDRARRMAAQLERDGTVKLARDYEIHYQDSYPKLKAVSELGVESDAMSGVLKLSENYKISEFWTKDEEDTDYEASFIASDIRRAVYKPDQTERDAPLYFRYPNNIKVQHKLTFVTDGWSFDAEKFNEDNPFFSFTKALSFKDNILTIDYVYRAKTDHIPVGQIENYLAARDRLRDEAYYGIIKFGQKEPVVKEETTLEKWTKIAVLMYLLGLVIILIDWGIASNRPKVEPDEYYPISPWKFLILSFLTLGIYERIWMYRMWSAIKLKTNTPMMPVARAIFSIYWFYPLFAHLKRDGQSRHSAKTIMPVGIAMLCAVFYFLIAIVGQFVDIYIVTVLSILLPLIFIPLVLYVNELNEHKVAAFVANSKWQVRHITTIALCLPLLLFVLASQTPLFPSDGIIKQSAIMKHDMKFLYRNKIVSPSEDIQYFYSDATFSIQDDGNGFTKQRIFSYWLNADDKLETEYVALKKVKDIKAKYATDSNQNTVITVIRENDTEFLLFVSTVDGGDKIFMEQLLTLWKLAH